MTEFLWLSAVGWATVVSSGWFLRSRQYAIFRGVTLAVHTLIAAGLFNLVQPVLPFFLVLHGLVFLHSLTLVRPRMRPLLYRALVSVPASFFSGGTLFALPWALASAVGFELPGVFLPYALALIGVAQSLTTRRQAIDIVIADGENVGGLRRHVAGALRVDRPLRIAQITDPHLGPFMSVGRLRRIVQRSIASDPDLVLLTGDFLTMESQSDPRLLGDALAPLRQLPGRVFACLGNHDHEAPFVVRKALEDCGATLLVDDSALLELPTGPVQIVGCDFAWRDRRQHLRQVCEAHPRQPDALRIFLLHDPSAFVSLPDGEADLVLSGHTHGGQVGLVSLGLPYTMMRLFAKIPDHGLWARGTDRLYVHRGTGHYGFPLRLGVPAEESVLHVHAPILAAAS